MKKESNVNNSTLSSIRFMMYYLTGHRFQFVIFFFGWALISICEVMVPVIFSIMINQIIYYKDLQIFLELSSFFVILIGFNTGLYYLIYQVYAYLSNMYTYKVRHSIFKKMQKLDSKTMSKSNYGNIAVQIQWHSQVCMDFIVRNIIHSFNHVLRIFICIIIIFSISPYLFITISILVPIVVYVNVKFGQKVRKASDENNKHYADYIGWIYEIIQGLRDVRLLGAITFVNEKFEINNNKIITTENQNKLYILSSTNIILVVNVFFRVIIFVILALLVNYSKIKIGDVIIVYSYYEIIKKNMQILSDRYMDSQKRISVVKRLQDFMELPTINERAENENLIIYRGDIKFEDVVFSYDENNKVLDGLNLNIQCGEKLAIVGKSGCGKTTLAHLLVGLLELRNGKIEVDCQNIQECNLKSIQREIGLIQQEVMIFNMTIYENIMLGNKYATKEQLIQACKNAGIYDFIISLEHGFDTILGKGGRNLSGGQKQRIAIARIYLKNPQIIIFDEATSALDDKTEEVIHNSWNNFLKGKTVIIVAHKLSSVMQCDKVALIDNGKVKIVGTPNELYKNDVEFRKLFAVDKG